MNPPSTFPYKLYNMLKSLDEFFTEGTAPVMWLPHGCAFLIKDQKRFIEEVVSPIFNHKKWRSFTRQLNLWGFKRVLGPDRGAWYHENFLREDPTKLNLIKRVAVKGNTKGERFALTFNKYFNPPNFYDNGGLTVPPPVPPSNYTPKVRSESTKTAADALLVTDEIIIDSVAESRSYSNHARDDLGSHDFSSEYQTFPRGVTIESELFDSFAFDPQGMLNDAFKHVLQAAGCVVTSSLTGLEYSAMIANTIPVTNRVQAANIGSVDQAYNLKNETRFPAQAHLRGVANASVVKMETELFTKPNQLIDALLSNVFLRPSRNRKHAEDAVVENFTNCNVEASNPCELYRRSGVPCLAAGADFSNCAPDHAMHDAPEQAIQWCDGIQSLGIHGHPQVEFDNMDVSDEEFEEFLSQYWH